MPKYDVAIVGAGLGGLAAAALLSSKNKKTIVIEQGPSLSVALGGIEKDGFLFSALPSLSYGFEPGGALQEFSTGLGIVQHAVVPSPCYQVALPDHRITVFAEHEATLEELTREFPKEIHALSAFYRDLEKLALRTRGSRVLSYLAQLRSAAGFMGKFQFSRPLTAFFDVQALWFFQKPAAALSLEAFLTLYNTPPRRLRGGFRKFGDQLCGVLLQHGGEIRYNEPSPELLFKNNRIVGVKTVHEVIEADTVILNTQPAQSRQTLFVGLQDEVVPLSMATDVLFLPEYSRAEEVMVLSMDSREDSTAEHAGSRALTVSCASQQNVQKNKNAQLEQVGRLIPFLSDFMLFAEAYEPGAGHAVLPADIGIKPLRPRGGGPVCHRTSNKDLFVLHDRPESPLQVISAVRCFVKRWE